MNGKRPLPAVTVKSAVAGYSLANLAGNGARIVISFLTVVLASRWMGANDFGTANLLLAYTTYLFYLLTLGFDNGIPYFMGKARPERSLSRGMAMLKAGSVISLAVFAVLITTAVFAIPPLLRTMRLDGLFIPALLFVAQCEAGALGYVLDGFLRGAKRFLPVIARDQVLFPLLNLAGLIVFVKWLSGGVPGYAVGYSLATMLSLLFGIAVVLRMTAATSTHRVSRVGKEAGRLRDWLAFSLPLAIMSALDPILYSSSVVMAGWFLAPTDVAKFVVSVRVAIFAQFLMTALAPVFSPFMSELFRKGDAEEYGELYRTVINWSAKWAVLFACFLAAAPGFVLSLFGKDYPSAATCLILVLPGCLLEGALGGSRLSLVMAGRNRINVALFLAAIAVNLVAGYVMIPRYGLSGVAAAFSLSYGAMNILRVGFFFAYFGILPLDSKRTIKLVVLSIASLAFVVLVRTIGLAPVKGALFAAAFFLLGMTFAFLDDIRLIAAGIGRSRRQSIPA